MFITTATGKSFQVDINAEDTVGVLKHRITDEIGAPTQHLQLYFNGHELKNSHTLASYGVDPSSEVQ
jgi:Ubiquitin family